MTSRSVYLGTAANSYVESSSSSVRTELDYLLERMRVEDLERISHSIVNDPTLFVARIGRYRMVYRKVPDGIEIVSVIDAETAKSALK